MNRLRGKKLLRRFVFLLLFVVLCRSFWPLYVTPWGAQRAFQRQYHWGPGRVLCQEEGQQEYRLLAWEGDTALVVLQRWGPFWMAEGNVPALLMGENGLLYSWRSWGGEEYELVVYGKTEDNRISQVEVEFLTGETRRQEVTSEGGFLLVESRGTSDDFYVKTIRGLDEKGNIITEDVIIKR